MKAEKEQKTKVRLKRPNEFDFNKTNGRFHAHYDMVKERFGLKRRFIVINSYSFYGNVHLQIADLKGKPIVGENDFTWDLFTKA